MSCALFLINRTNEMNTIQQTPWGTIVPWVERVNGPLVGLLYMIGGRMIIAEKRGDNYALLLNGREKSFPDRTTMTRWVKAHLV